ncbi:nSTAND1 domain-containing NTPase [Calditrichota bacterium LG25]
MNNTISGFRFGEFELDLKNRQLKKNNREIPLNSKYFDVLVLLVENQQQLTTKERIFDTVWKDTIVTESALSQCIKDIRKCLGDSAHHPTYIKTIAKHGYMFIADVEPVLSERFRKAEKAESFTRPYKFLDYFKEEDQHLFFGREKEIDLLFSKILAHRSFILYGKSGVGKSSLIRAGLAPAFKNSGFPTFIIRSFHDPADQLLQSFNNLTGETNDSLQQIDWQTLLTKIKRRLKKSFIIFFFDQFEDFFLLLKEKDRQALVNVFSKMLNDEQINIRLVFVLREDLLAEMSYFKPLLPEIFHHEYRLLKLDREQAVKAILEPARAVGCPFEPELAERILKDLANGDQPIDPPQLQIVCDALYDARDAQHGITLQKYETMGGAAQILENYMTRVLHRFDGAKLHLAREILKLLISFNGQRLVVPVEQIISRFASSDHPAQEIHALINELSDARLIRIGRQEGKNWVELSHDFLLPQIKKWISDEEKGLYQARSILERGLEAHRHHGLLLDEDAIQIVLPFERHLRMTPEEASFLARSLLYRKYVLPDWLKNQVPDLANLLIESLNDDDPAVRIVAAESSLHIHHPQLEQALFKLALWDKDLNVRKTASIVYLKNYGRQGQDKLARGKNDKKAGLVRRAISLAFARDFDIHLVYLRKLPLMVILLVVTGLIWVRLYRNRKQISKKISGATFGATMSGLLVGSLLTLMLALLKHHHSFEAITYLLVLISLGGMASFFAGLGISSGIATMRYVTYRHSLWWMVVGGTLGGLLIGGMINLIGVDILRTLFGQELINITGALEGTILGFCLSLALTISEIFYPKHRMAKILTAALFSTIGAITLSLFEGNLFSGSIAAISRSFSKSQINLEPLASLLGEVHFGLISRLVLSSIEGFLFGGLFTAGMEIFGNKHKETPL